MIFMAIYYSRCHYDHAAALMGFFVLLDCNRANWCYVSHVLPPLLLIRLSRYDAYTTHTIKTAHIRALMDWEEKVMEKLPFSSRARAHTHAHISDQTSDDNGAAHWTMHKNATLWILFVKMYQPSRFLRGTRQSDDTYSVHMRRVCVPAFHCWSWKRNGFAHNIEMWHGKTRRTWIGRLSFIHSTLRRRALAI